jgi:hypothetical protein
MNWSLRRNRKQAFVAPAKLDRVLSPDEDAALRWILWLEDFPGSDELRVQVEHVRATWGRTTEIDLEVVAASPAPVSDGFLPVTALVVDQREEPTGFIQVFVADGYLSSLYYSWVTDRMPTDYPSADRLRLFDAA